jgi:hypothetical protein
VKGCQESGDEFCNRQPFGFSQKILEREGFVYDHAYKISDSVKFADENGTVPTQLLDTTLILFKKP